jgi:hypothetical protein
VCVAWRRGHACHNPSNLCISSRADVLFRLRHDTDSFNRWQAGWDVASSLILKELYPVALDTMLHAATPTAVGACAAALQQHCRKLMQSSPSLV